MISQIPNSGIYRGCLFAVFDTVNIFQVLSHLCESAVKGRASRSTYVRLIYFCLAQNRDCHGSWTACGNRLHRLRLPKEQLRDSKCYEPGELGRKVWRSRGWPARRCSPDKHFTWFRVQHLQDWPRPCSHSAWPLAISRPTQFRHMVSISRERAFSSSSESPSTRYSPRARFRD